MRIKLFENFGGWEQDYPRQENLRFKYHEDKLRTDFDGVLVELLDKGFKYEINFKKDLVIYIEHSQTDWFFFDKIYEELMMLIDYMKLKFRNDVEILYDYDEYNKNREERRLSIKQKVMEKEDKHVLMSYFQIDFKMK